MKYCIKKTDYFPTENESKPTYPGSDDVHANVKHLTSRLGVRVVTSYDLVLAAKTGHRHIVLLVIWRLFLTVHRA